MAPPGPRYSDRSVSTGIDARCAHGGRNPGRDRGNEQDHDRHRQEVRFRVVEPEQEVCDELLGPIRDQQSDRESEQRRRIPVAQHETRMRRIGAERDSHAEVPYAPPRPVGGHAAHTDQCQQESGSLADYRSSGRALIQIAGEHQLERDLVGGGGEAEADAAFDVGRAVVVERGPDLLDLLTAGKELT